MPDDVAQLYTAHVLKSTPLDAVRWMYLDDEGDLMIGIDHYLASYETPRIHLENAIQNLWQYGAGPRQFDDYDFAGQENGMELRSRRVPAFPGDAAANLYYPEMHGTPARLHTRNDPDLFPLSPWQQMVDEAEELFDMPHGPHFETDYYFDCSTFRMDAGDLAKMFLSDVRGVIDEIRGRVQVDGVIVSDFSTFGSFPADAQLAVLDMGYQIGAAKLARFSALRMAIGRGEWKAAAERVPDIAEPERTRWRREQFLKAFEATKPKVAPGTPQPVVKTTHPVVKATAVAKPPKPLK